MKRPLAFMGCVVALVMLFLGIGYATTIDFSGFWRVALWIGGSLMFGITCALVYYNEKNNEHTIVDPSIDIQTLANYKKDIK